MKWLLTGLGSLLSLHCLSVQAGMTPVYQIDEATATWIQTPLTHDIYRYTADPSLNNLVVVDNDGNKLPYRLIAPRVDATKKTAQVPVRFFPVVAGATQETIAALNSASIRIHNNEVSIEVNQTPQEKQTAPVDFYVVDISNVKEIARALVLDWDATESNQYLQVQLSGSRDLQQWQSLSEHTLAKLHKEGQSLIRNSLEFNSHENGYNYLRLKCTTACEGLVLTSIDAEVHEQQPDVLPEDNWQIKGVLAADQQSAVRAGAYTNKLSVAAWEYERDDRAPVSRIGINLGNHYYGDTLRIFSRRTAKQPWQLQYEGIWFNAQVGTEWHQSEAIPVYTNSDQYWRIELNESVRNNLDPLILFKRTPQILQFIANHRAPYRIALDSQVASNNQQIHAQIFSQLAGGEEKTWTSVNPLALAPDKALAEPTPINWKTILFWGTLLIAVAILIGVAIRLAKQMKPT